MKAWLKCGIIVSLISLFGILSDLIRSFLNIGYEDFIISVLLFSFFTLPGEVLVEIVDRTIIRTTIEKIMIYILSLIFWFLIGALIGHIYGKIKSKKKFNNPLITR